MSAKLSKSDFKIASSCKKKLVYKKSGYPTTNDANEYMEMLAQGGYVIGKMATIYYPEGIEVSNGHEDALKETQNYLKRDEVTLFEPVFEYQQKIIRVDILQKLGKSLRLIEVKAKSIDTSLESPLKGLDDYIEDVAFQYMVLKEIYPDFKIEAYLFMPDKSRRTLIDGLAGWFSILDETTDVVDEDISQAESKPLFKKPKVIFKYEDHPNREIYIDQLKNNGIMSLFDITDSITSSVEKVKKRADSYINILNDGITDDDYKIDKKCKNCEFKLTEGNSGFDECWKNIPQADPHIFDLYYGGAIGHHTSGYYLDELIQQGRTSLYDINLERLKKGDGTFGTRAQRQLIQLENTQSNTEWFSPDFDDILSEFEYPLHFIDFETYTGAIPFHKGMRPYELIAFQWSCHTILEKGATPVHNEWIHTGDAFPDPEKFPNFEFAHSLMELIKDNGTPFMWATHENTVLRTILNQMEVYGVNDERLKKWLISMTKDEGREGRWVDMNQLTLENYFHPLMKGKTSIKKVLPAIWSSNIELHDVSHFKEYSPEAFEDGIIDPYDTLTRNLKFVEESEHDDVKGGTDAMRAYQRIRFDESISSKYKEELRKKLLSYCELDTMAMVIIAYHWGLK